MSLALFGLLLSWLWSLVNVIDLFVFMFFVVVFGECPFKVGFSLSWLAYFVNARDPSDCSCFLSSFLAIVIDPF